MKTLTLNGVKGLRLPKGFVNSPALWIVTFDGHFEFDLDRPRHVHLLACACMAHWSDEALHLLWTKKSTTKYDAATEQIDRWRNVAFPAKDGTKIWPKPSADAARCDCLIHARAAHSGREHSTGDK